MALLIFLLELSIYYIEYYFFGIDYFVNRTRILLIGTDVEDC